MVCVVSCALFNWLALASFACWLAFQLGAVNTVVSAAAGAAAHAGVPIMPPLQYQFCRCCVCLPHDPVRTAMSLHPLLPTLHHPSIPMPRLPQFETRTPVFRPRSDFHGNGGDAPPFLLTPQTPGLWAGFSVRCCCCGAAFRRQYSRRHFVGFPTDPLWFTLDFHWIRPWRSA